MVVRRRAVGADDARREAVRRHRQRRLEAVPGAGTAPGEAGSDSPVHVSTSRASPRTSPISDMSCFRSNVNPPNKILSVRLSTVLFS